MLRQQLEFVPSSHDVHCKPIDQFGHATQKTNRPPKPFSSARMAGYRNKPSEEGDCDLCWREGRIGHEACPCRGSRCASRRLHETGGEEMPLLQDELRPPNRPPQLKCALPGAHRPQTPRVAEKETTASAALRWQCGALRGPFSPGPAPRNPRTRDPASCPRCAAALPRCMGKPRMTGCLTH